MVEVLASIPNAMFLVVSHMRAVILQITEWASLLRGGKPTTQLAIKRPSAPTISVVILQTLINIISLEPGRFSDQKARMNNQLREILTACNPNARLLKIAYITCNYIKTPYPDLKTHI